MKQSLRKQYLSLRRSMRQDEVMEKSELILHNLKKFRAFQEADSLLLYVSFDNEVATPGIIEYLSMEGRSIFLPSIVNKRIKPLPFTGFDDLREGPYGILQPSDPPDHIVPQQIDLTLVPGIVFDRSGYRIGYGKGYYDCLLSELHTEAAGLAYEFQVIGRIPHDDHDVPLEYIVTESGVIERAKGVNTTTR